MGAVGGARTLTVGAGTYNGTLTDRGVALGYGATSISYDESGVLSLTKVGEETLTLGGTVSYTGLTDIQGERSLLLLPELRPWGISRWRPIRG